MKFYKQFMDENSGLAMRRHRRKKADRKRKKLERENNKK